MLLTQEKTRFLQKKAADIRCSVIEMLIEAKSGHLAGALGMADIFSYLYFHAFKHDPKKPDWQYRDRLVLSNGHICPVLYSAMAHAGYFDLNELRTLRKMGSRLQGHPHREWLPMLETSSGPVGSGLSQAIGMALANRIDYGKTSGIRFYCIMGDGEMDEGNTWEAIMLAGKEILQNVTVILDRNSIQVDGNTETVMPLEPFAEKWRAFNWNVAETDGHSFDGIDRALMDVSNVQDRPSVIIAYTIPAKGIPEFENKAEWHGKVPLSTEEVSIAMNAVQQMRNNLYNSQ